MWILCVILALLLFLAVMSAFCYRSDLLDQKEITEAERRSHENAVLASDRREREIVTLKAELKDKAAALDRSERELNRLSESRRVLLESYGKLTSRLAAAKEAINAEN
jgi:hypothetical protein